MDYEGTVKKIKNVSDGLEKDQSLLAVLMDKESIETFFSGSPLEISFIVEHSIDFMLEKFGHVQHYDKCIYRIMETLKQALKDKLVRETSGDN